MTIKQLDENVGDFVYSKVPRPHEVTYVMPINDFHELGKELLVLTSFQPVPGNDELLIKHIFVHGVRVSVMEGDKLELGVGGPKRDQKFFQRKHMYPIIFSKEVSQSILPHINSTKPIIPSDATNLEVFHIKNQTAFIGFKISNGNFHYVQVPYNPGKPQAKVIQMQTLPHRA